MVIFLRDAVFIQGLTLLCGTVRTDTMRKHGLNILGSTSTSTSTTTSEAFEDTGQTSTSGASMTGSEVSGPATASSPRGGRHRPASRLVDAYAASRRGLTRGAEFFSADPPALASLNFADRIVGGDAIKDSHACVGSPPSSI